MKKGIETEQRPRTAKWREDLESIPQHDTQDTWLL